MVAALDVITAVHDNPGGGIAAPLVGEASSWISLVVFSWIALAAWRAAPVFVRPRWKLLLHLPGAFVFALGHVGGFTVLRALASALAGCHYLQAPFVPQFLYELRKDIIAYLVCGALLALFDHLLRRQTAVASSDAAATFDIRDGARFERVPIANILAVGAAGNYVEFVLDDGRRLLMRSPLSALESKLAPFGFLRTHRSWLVNGRRVKGLKPTRSGDYAVELAGVAVPLSRRFPHALAKLKGAPEGAPNSGRRAVERT